MKMLLPLKYKSIIGICCIAILMMSFSSGFQKDKTLTQSFIIDGVGNLTIDNLHGDLDIRNWDQKEIKIEVTIGVSSRNTDASRKFIEGTSVEFSQSNNDVYAITQLAKVDLKKKWWQWGVDSYSFSVDYTVYVPELVNLNLENHHGNIDIQRYDGDLDVDIAHGELNTDFITGKTELKIEHGEVVMRGLSNGKIDIHFSEFETISAGNLEINSTRTEIDINEALDIRAFSKYDEYKIGSMGNFINEGAYDDIEIGAVRYLDISSRFSEVKVDVCEVGIDLDLFHGELEIDHITPAFDGGILNFQHTDVDLTFADDLILELNSEHTDLDLESMNRSKGDNSERSKSTFYKGNSQNAKVLKVISKYGSLEIND